MSSETHEGRRATATPSASVPAEYPPAAAPQGEDRGDRHRRRARRVQVVLAVALVLALVAAGYLLVLSRAWADRAGELESTAHGLGGEVGQLRADLEETRGTLALVESQLDGAQDQIHELADAAAQIGDDREVQRQVAEYQEELSLAATAVAEAMDECISSQQDLITYLELAPGPDPSPSPSPTPSPEPTDDPTPDPAEELRADVESACLGAAEANEALQERLSNQ